jgi:hypothetical protein
MAKLELPSLHLINDLVGNNLWITMNDYPFMLDGRLMFIPLFFLHDKYSVPFGVVFPRSREVAKENIPAVLHDYLIRNRKLLHMSMDECHDVFLQAMKLCGIGFVTRYLKYTAVMCFNWLIAGDGDGTPPRQVQEFIDKHGYGC